MTSFLGQIPDAPTEPSCERRFGWRREHPSLYERATGWLLLYGLRATSPRRERRDRVTLLLDENEVALATSGVDQLSRFPRAWRRLQRQLDYVAIGPGSSEVRLPARLAFVSNEIALSVTEFAIELNELGLLAWHLQVGGGLGSTLWRPVVERTIVRSSWKFAEQLLIVEREDLIRERICNRFRRRRSELSIAPADTE